MEAMEVVKIWMATSSVSVTLHQVLSSGLPRVPSGYKAHMCGGEVGVCPAKIVPWTVAHSRLEVDARDQKFHVLGPSSPCAPALVTSP